MAIIGTKQHDVVDTGDDDLTLPDFRAMAAAECVLLCEEVARNYPGGTILKENYLPIDNELVKAPDGTAFSGTTAGYLDWAIVSADETQAEMLDWKFGNNAVEDAKNNLQGMSYGLGLLKRYPKLERIKVTFVMPHLDHQSTYTFTRDQFGTMYLRVITVVHRAVEAAKDPADFSLARANASSCRFCGLIGRCPKVAEMVIAVGKKYAPLKVPKTVTPTLICDPTDAKDGIALADIVKVWAEAYKRLASARAIDDPHFIPDGYTLVSMSRRTIKSARKIVEITKSYLPEENHHEVDALLDIPLGKCEKLIELVTPRGKKAGAVEEFGLALLSEAAVEEGTPYAFLRQSRKTDVKSTETTTTN